MSIAKTILNQLGGSKAIVMMGAYNVSAIDKGLGFRFKGSKKANYVSIKLNIMDTYDIEFMKIKKFDFDSVGEFESIYCDQLKSTVEEFTGLYLSL